MSVRMERRFRVEFVMMRRGRPECLSFAAEEAIEVFAEITVAEKSLLAMGSGSGSCGGDTQAAAAAGKFARSSMTESLVRIRCQGFGV